MGSIIISVSKDFSRTPGAGKRSEGSFSGQEFLETHLAPAFERALKNSCELVVNLDGTIGYGTAFLEQAFGGLARKYPELTVLDTLKILSDEEPYLVDDVTTYVREATGS